jgi:NAD(P)-dependent dehydrogenase (short-subunit alcohol dehydrogenase family)
MRPTLLLIGAGGLGSTILELLARTEGLGEIVVADRDTARGEARCNLARLGALAQGPAPTIRFLPLDLHNADAVAEAVHRIAPDIILTTASLQTWWLADLLPPEAAAAVKRAGFGVWLPVNLTLTLKLMRALRDADYHGVTIVAPYPDVVNVVLGRLGLAPTCGLGNLDEIVPKVRLLAAERLNTPVEAVRVLLVAHHAVEPFVFGKPMTERPPYFLRIEHGGEDVTAAVQGDDLLFALYPIPSGPVTHFLTAGSAVRLVRAFISPGGAFLHAPGPLGLPGGYPIIVEGDTVRLAPIAGLTPQEAVAINERAHRFDGIERIEADGTVVFCSWAVEALRQTLGYDCPRLAPDQAEERAGELMARFRRFAEQHGVTLP